MSEKCETVKPKCGHLYVQVSEDTIIYVCTRSPWERCPLAKPVWETDRVKE